MRADLILITFAAAVVNGALGYGFSSITVPLALLFVTNRVLNPALVLIEVGLNAYVLWVNRAAIGSVRARVTPIIFGLMPGVIAGTLLVSRLPASHVKLATYLLLLPLILLQAAGYRRPIRSERALGYPLGAAVGVLYSVTTISGPPLAVTLNNQGLAKQEFRAALGFIRLAESSFTAAVYLQAGLFSTASIQLIPSMLPSLALGVPVGAWLIHRVDAEVFRRVCMSFDAWLVAFGISTLLARDYGVATGAALSVMPIVGAIDAVMLFRFFRRRALRQPQRQVVTETSDVVIALQIGELQYMPSLNAISSAIVARAVSEWRTRPGAVLICESAPMAEEAIRAGVPRDETITALPQALGHTTRLVAAWYAGSSYRGRRPTLVTHTLHADRALAIFARAGVPADVIRLDLAFDRRDRDWKLRSRRLFLVYNAAAHVYCRLRGWIQI